MDAGRLIVENQEEERECIAMSPADFEGRNYPKKSMSFIKEDELYGACLILRFRIQTGFIDFEYGVRISFLVRGLCDIAWYTHQPRACSFLNHTFFGLIIQTHFEYINFVALTRLF
jgi:hypothetical protein